MAPRKNTKPESAEATAPVASTVVPAEKKVKITDAVSVIVESCFSGTLIFKNSKTGEKIKWRDRGRTQDLTIADLKDMRATQSDFFENQWIKIVEGADDDGNTFVPADIIKHLRIEHFYKKFIDPNNFDDLCQLPANEIAARVDMLSDGAKSNLVTTLRGYVNNGRLDSLIKIKAFEKALGCSLLS